MTAVVYWLLDADDNILYIGCTMSLRPRMIQHAYTKGAWWPDVASVAITDRMPRKEALQVERRDIIEMRPRYNIRIDIPELDRPVYLGDGNRKLVRDLNVFDLMEMDRLRYRNVNVVNTAYASWREDYERALPAVTHFGSFGAAVESDAFKP